MNKVSYFLFYALGPITAFGLSIFEPTIECTVIEVYSTVSILGFKKFPKLHQSINNVAKPSLYIAGKRFEQLRPRAILKTDTFEKISIPHQNGNLFLELSGKPISRNGKLIEGDKVLAKVTCH